MNGVLDEALFARLEDAEIPPVDPDNADGEDAPLADLASLLRKDKLGADNIAVWEHPSGGWGMHTSRNLAASKTVWREAGLPATSVLDLAAVLTAHPTAHAKLGSRASAGMAF